MNWALSSIETASRELTRLEGIRDRLSGLIVELQTREDFSADVWISIYNERLKNNVMPQIAEIRQYLKEQSLMVR